MRKYSVDTMGGLKGMTRLCVHSKTWLKKAVVIGTMENLEAADLVNKGCHFVDATKYSMPVFEKYRLNPFFGQSLKVVNIPVV